MKKLLFILGLVGLIAAGCNTSTSQTTSTNTNSSTVPSESGTNYVVAVHDVYTGTHPKESSISLIKSDGSISKTLSVPKDMLTGLSGTLQVVGDHLYYLGGSTSLTSIGVIDPKTDKDQSLAFTQTKMTSAGNVLTGISQWTISNDGSKVAWEDNSGTLKVADINGSNLQTYKLSAANLEFNKDSELYFVDGHYNLKKIDLTSGQIITVLSVQPELSGALSFILSNNGKYLAYNDLSQSTSSNIVIKNLETNAQCSITNADLVYSENFSPDGSKLAFSPDGGPGVSPVNLIIANTSDCSSISDINNYYLTDFLDNSTVLAGNSAGSVYAVDLQGNNPKKILSNDSDHYAGILTLSK